MRVLEITTVSSCSNDCHFCPQDAYRKAYKGKPRLSLEDFNAVLAKLPKDIHIIFSGYSEPFLNSDYTSMVESAVSKGFKVKVYSTLVGMHAEDVHRLAKCKLIGFTLHLPDNRGNTKIPASTQEYKDVLSLALQNIAISETVTMGDDFVDNERAGLGPTAHGRHLRGMFNCYKLENPQFVLLPNCDVALCCNDFGLRHVLGNLLKQSYEEITASPEFRKVKAGRYRMNGDTLCRSCTFAVPLLTYHAYSTVYTNLRPTVAKLLKKRYFG